MHKLSHKPPRWYMHIPMIRARPHDPSATPCPPRLPDWLVRLTYETPEDAGFSAGVALVLVDMAQQNPSLPQALWRARLAQRAAAHVVALSGRREGEAALRDILCLLRPGEQPGPAGEIALAWHCATARPLSEATLARALPDSRLPQIEFWRVPAPGTQVAQAAYMIEAVLNEAPRDTLSALILADATLARAAGWSHLVPLLGSALHRRDLQLRGQDLRLACSKALVTSSGGALPLLAALARRAAQLHAVAPKLRSKHAAQAVEMFLNRDAIAPAALTTLMSDRAARRLCDRLVALGAARELTGRDSFRLYGL